MNKAFSEKVTLNFVADYYLEMMLVNVGVQES